MLCYIYPGIFLDTGNSSALIAAVSKTNCSVLGKEFNKTSTALVLHLGKIISVSISLEMGIVIESSHEDEENLKKKGEKAFFQLKYLTCVSWKPALGSTSQPGQVLHQKGEELQGSGCRNSQMSACRCRPPSVGSQNHQRENQNEVAEVESSSLGVQPTLKLGLCPVGCHILWEPSRPLRPLFLLALLWEYWGERDKHALYICVHLHGLDRFSPISLPQFIPVPHHFHFWLTFPLFSLILSAGFFLDCCLAPAIQGRWISELFRRKRPQALSQGPLTSGCTPSQPGLWCVQGGAAKLNASSSETFSVHIAGQACWIWTRAATLVEADVSVEGTKVGKIQCVLFSQQKTIMLGNSFSPIGCTLSCLHGKWHCPVSKEQQLPAKSALCTNTTLLQVFLSGGRLLWRK